MILHPIYSGIKLNWFTEVCLSEAWLCSCSCVAYKTFCHPSCLLPLSDWLSTGQEGKGNLHAYIHEHVHMRKKLFKSCKNDYVRVATRLSSCVIPMQSHIDTFMKPAFSCAVVAYCSLVITTNHSWFMKNQLITTILYNSLNW